MLDRARAVQHDDGSTTTRPLDHADPAEDLVVPSTIHTAPQMVTMERTVRVGLFLCAMLIASQVALPWIAGRVFQFWPAVTSVETGKTPEYPDISPQSYPQPVLEVFQAAQRVASSLSGWRVVVADQAALEIRAEAVTWLFRFTHDVTITVAPYEDRAVVSVRSASRITHADLGQNARNVRAFFRSLDRHLAP